jgi:N-acylglucosamine 2-epimerase
MPFWMRHAIDRTHGGLLTCLADDGRILSTDKYLWSQARALWTFSALYRRIERRPEWLEVARGLYDFCRRFGVGEDGCWRFRVSREGVPIDGPLAIVVDCFAIFGMVEFARATGEAEALEIARRAYVSIEDRLNSGKPFGTAPYPLPLGMKGHRYSMQCSLAFHELGSALGDAQILEASRRHTRQILDHYARPEHRALVEYVNLDGSFSDTPAGRTMVPGHGIESMWFQLQIFRESQRRDETSRVLGIMEDCLERAWDPLHGGLLLALDIFDRGEPFWKCPTAKLWWPATEAMCATLLAYEADPHERWLVHHRRIAEWALRHFPLPEHGEWQQRLDREGRPLREVVALPVKDPFHLPRALIVGIEALDRIYDSKSSRATTSTSTP